MRVGGATGGYALAIFNSSCSIGSSSGAIFQNYKSASAGTGCAIRTAAISMLYSNGPLTVRNNRIGIYCYNGKAELEGYSASGKYYITGNIDGIYVPVDCSLDSQRYPLITPITYVVHLLPNESI